MQNTQTNKRMIKYPSIDQYRTVVKNIKHHAAYLGKDESGEPIFDFLKPSPILTFSISEKIHGSNMAVCYSLPTGLWVQSRNNIITLESDNAGCAFEVEKNKEEWLQIIEELAEENNIDLEHNIISVYAEWCGGNIQKNSAVSGLDKRAIIFQFFKCSSLIHSEDDNKSSYWLETCITGTEDDPNSNEKTWISDNDENIYNIMDFPNYSQEIDFNKPEIAQNKLITLMENIEEASPVGKAFGKEDNIGEGIVCSCLHEGALYQFKVKGDKHSNSKVKTPKVVDLEALEALDRFVESITHNWRFEQGLVEVFGSDYQNTIDRKKIGLFMKWIAQDTIKEEMDLIKESGFELKPVMSRVNQKAKEYFFAMEEL